MVELYAVSYVSLHVRETNYAAYHLYHDTLKFAQHGMEPKYYADGENAFDMRRQLSRELFGLPPKPSLEAAPPAAALAATKAVNDRKQHKTHATQAPAGAGAESPAAPTPSVGAGAEESLEAEVEATRQALEKADVADHASMTNIDAGKNDIDEAVAAIEAAGSGGASKGAGGKKAKGKKR